MMPGNVCMHDDGSFCGLCYPPKDKKMNHTKLVINLKKQLEKAQESADFNLMCFKKYEKEVIELKELIASLE